MSETLSVNDALIHQDEAAVILIVEDDRFFLDNLRNVIKRAGHDVLLARDGKEALDRLAGYSIDLMLLDLQLPRVHGMDVLRQTIEKYPAMPAIIISGEGTISMALEAMRLGAYDYIEKPLDLRRLLVTVRNALEKSRLQRHRDRLLEEVGEPYRLVGHSPAMQTIHRLIDRAAATPGRVLIQGEHGTGKELVARAIHNQSARATYPFVPVNCGAIPENLIESELFGHERGAFTGAVATRVGSFERANRGTLFLDEIGNISQAAQIRLLRVLQEREIVRVGGTKSIELDIRVIAATNKDLNREIQAGKFREDLYYRLNVIEIHVPPLREHIEDIPVLTDYFLADLYHTAGYAPKTFDPDALAILMQHDWPGNIRQLRNVVERLMALTENDVIGADEITAALSVADNDPRLTDARSLRDARERFEQAFILKTLRRNDWKLQDTADALGIERTNLWKKIKRYGLRRK